MQELADKVKALVFDWDGTLVDTMPIKIRNAASLFREKFGADEKRIAESYRSHSGVPRRNLFDSIALDNFGKVLADAEFETMSKEFSFRNLAMSKHQAAVFPGTHDTLTKLMRMELKLFVSSSAIDEEVLELAKAIGLRPYFEEVLGSRGNFHKGVPHFRHICETANLSLDELVFVGDEKADVLIANAARVKSVWVSHERSVHEIEPARADYVVVSIDELLTLF